MTSLETAAIPPNIAAQLPSVNFGFDELKEKMAKFTSAFDEFIEKRREKALEARTNFARDLADLNESQKTVKKNIEHYEHEEMKIASSTSLAPALSLCLFYKLINITYVDTEKEIKETADLEDEISTIKGQKATRQAENETLSSQIREQSVAISKKRAKLLEEKQALASQANHNQPELAFWEDYLGLRIEGAGRLDHVRFIFTCLDESDPEREFEIVVSVESRDYEIIGARPKLDDVTKARCLETLNETRSIAKFLKSVREEFKKSVKN
ncbi:kinetochore-associated Ndc80 complex subunit spc25 [Orbilia ellipsospora]|uniref:Kinetochore protein SPC25 n=1 Tax=Orbilia ellipsospora TaxID=2528407 RepID=A0AAV9X5Q2_9PEZI